MRKIKRIIVHCSDTPTGRDNRVEDIHRWHQDKGWDAIGYHYVICIDGTLELGRPEWWVGSHAKGYNGDSLGVCLIGCGEYTEAQWDTLHTLIMSLTNEHVEAVVMGHSEVSDKTCPNFDVNAWWYKD